MCLLERVVEWDEQRILCLTHSHRLSSNPLRSRDQLSSACGIEYAAQAMAVHGVLRAPASADERPRAGFLLSVRSTQLYVARLDDISSALDITATCIHSSADNVLYQFSLHSAGKLLLEGRAAVMLNAASTLEKSA